MGAATANDTVRINPMPASPSGEVEVQFGTTVPPAGEQGVAVRAQSFCNAPNGSARFSSSAATVLLDAAFSGP